MNDVTVFNNENFGALRTIERDGEVWFVGKDVATMLGYSNPRDAVFKKVDAEDKLRMRIKDAGQYREVSIINESGLYSLVLASELPTAKNFKRWVTSEVLPTIRKTGRYETQQQYQPTEYDLRQLELRERESRREDAKLLLQVADDVSNELYKDTLRSLATTVIMGKEYLPLPKRERDTYSATEISKLPAKRYNIQLSSKMIGKVANVNHLKRRRMA